MSGDPMSEAPFDADPAAGSAPSADAGISRWAKVIDHTSCIGCHACTTACKSENDVPLGVTRTYVKYADVGTFPQARRAFQVTRCNQCDDAPCTTACPTTAMFRRSDGIVDFDKDACIGCKACMAACPYDAIFINPEDHSAEKCNFCAHRIDMGLEPACVVVCPTQAILVGDMDDPASRVAQIAHREAVSVRRPEKETRPKLFYQGAHQATLDPLAARRPDGGLFLWSEQKDDEPHDVVSGHPGEPASSAAALLSYDVPHKAPWDWRVSLYTLTKGIAAGAYLVPFLLVLAGRMPQTSAIWQWAAPLVGLLFLALTGGILISDLEHPKRFYYLFTRPQWKSWLVRGAVVLVLYGAVLTAHLALALFGHGDKLLLLGFVGGPAAAMAAIYTAFLFAQAKARDLWQSPLLPFHLLLQALVAGAAIFAPVLASRAAGLPADAAGYGGYAGMLWILALGGLVHLFLVWGEISLPHVTAHATLAIREMTRGRFRSYFLSGLGFTVVMVAAAGIALAATAGTLDPALGLVAAGAAAGAALAALFAYEHAYVQAGQSVPLA